LLVDFACHPFQYDLACALARRGVAVSHTFCATVVTPRVSPAPAERLRIFPIFLRHSFEKYRLFQRLRDELVYGWKTVSVARSVRPSHLLTSNVPLVSLLCLSAWASLTRTPWVLWLQDMQSGLASLGQVRRTAVGRALEALERWLVCRADQVIVISSSFQRAVRGFGVDADRVHLIENWAPLDAVPMRLKRNEWSIAHGLDSRFVFLYSGTLARKHSPESLGTLMAEFADDPDVAVVVVAEGAGMEWLRAHVMTHPDLDALLLPFQPFDALPDVLGSADVLVTLLSDDAGSFSVPSKLMTYLCAGRPILASVPAQNAAATVVERSGAGVAVAPDDHVALRAAARLLREDDDARDRHGRAARVYAEENFDADAIAPRFEHLLRSATKRRCTRLDGTSNRGRWRRLHRRASGQGAA
jgi:glycosyltransferase involved in cell wall biosynthesis